MSSKDFDKIINQIEISQSDDNQNQPIMKENLQPSTYANVVVAPSTPSLKKRDQKRGPGQPRKDARKYEIEIQEAQQAGNFKRVRELKNNKSSQKYRNKKFQISNDEIKSLEEINNNLKKKLRAEKIEVKSWRDELKKTFKIE